RMPLVEGEEPSPLQRVLTAADSASGISGALDFSSWVYVNPDLTVYLHRPLDGDFVCLDAVTVPEPSGVGLTSATLHDRRGPIGRSGQSLFVAPR
ncbi:MAG TPA: thioesterase family protein, partial [Actinomycetota bacterium]|nr:thioesterase family protein [Actinomycetota bacterium]